MKPKSRPQRWAEAVAAVRAAIEKAQEAAQAINPPLDDLRDIQQEYQEWLDNLPGSLQTSPVAEKLEAVCQLSLDEVEDLFDEIQEAINEAEGLDLPQGFGKD